MNDDTPATLELSEVRFGYGDRPDFLGPVTLSVRGGACWAIVGPNGAGKSTLLRLMAGLRRPGGGRIALGGVELGTIPPRRRAQRIAFVPQHPPSDGELTVREVVLMGRFPHRSFGLFESAEDHRIAERAMAATDTADLADRSICTLSGGEAQRAHVAAALAQRPGLLLLDEPTASLDLHHQLAIFSILRDQARREGIGVVVVTHDVNLAAQFCSMVLVMRNGRVACCGAPGEALVPAMLEPVYGTRLAEVSVSGRPEGRWIVPLAPESGGEA